MSQEELQALQALLDKARSIWWYEYTVDNVIEKEIKNVPRRIQALCRDKK